MTQTFIVRSVRKIAKPSVTSACLSGCLSVCLSIRPQEKTRLPLYGFSWNLKIFFENLSRNCKFHSNMTKITGTLHEDVCAFMIVYRWNLLIMRNVSDKSCRENKNTHFVFSNFLSFFLSCRLWDNVEKYGTTGQAAGDNKTRWMRFACRTPKQQHRHNLLILNACCLSTTKNCYANVPQRYVHTYIACRVFITGKATVVSALIHAKLTHCMTIAPNSFQNYECITQ